MGFTVGWNTNCSGHFFIKPQNIMKLKKMYPKAKITANRDEIIVECNPDVYDKWIILFEISVDRYTNSEIDLDVSHPITFFTTLYTHLYFGCSPYLEKGYNKITKYDWTVKEILKEALSFFKEAGHNVDQKILKKTVKIFYGKNRK